MSEQVITVSASKSSESYKLPLIVDGAIVNAIRKTIMLAGKLSQRDKIVAGLLERGVVSIDMAKSLLE